MCGMTQTHTIPWQTSTREDMLILTFYSNTSTHTPHGHARMRKWEDTTTLRNLGDDFLVPFENRSGSGPDSGSEWVATQYKIQVGSKCMWSKHDASCDCGREWQLKAILGM